MNEQSRAILQALVNMAWADGQVSPEESGLILKAMSEAGAPAEDTEELARLLSSAPAPVDLNVAELDEEKRLGVMRALLIMSFMDGHVSFAEYAHIEAMQRELGISDEQLDALRAEAVAAAETISAS